MKKKKKNLFISEAYLDVFHEWTVKERLSSHMQCEQREETPPRRKLAFKLAKLLVFKYGKYIF